jgi:hypothetical protein
MKKSYLLSTVSSFALYALTLFNPAQAQVIESDDFNAELDTKTTYTFSPDWFKGKKSPRIHQMPKLVESKNVHFQVLDANKNELVYMVAKDKDGNTVIDDDEIVRFSHLQFSEGGRPSLVTYHRRQDGTVLMKTYYPDLAGTASEMTEEVLPKETSIGGDIVGPVLKQFLL